MASVAVTVEIDEGVAVVRIDDGKVNALTLDMIDGIQDALRSASASADAVVLTGRPGCLTAGLDRSVMLGADRSVVTGNLRRATDLYDEMMRLPVPLVVACPGHAVAAGALLLLVADARVGARVPSRIGLNEVQIGIPLFPLAVAAARARLAPQALFPATLGATLYDSAGALEVGYLDEVVEPDALLAVATTRAAVLGGLDRRSYLRTRRLVVAPILDEVERATSRRRDQAPTPG